MTRRTKDLITGATMMLGFVPKFLPGNVPWLTPVDWLLAISIGFIVRGSLDWLFPDPPAKSRRRRK